MNMDKGKNYLVVAIIIFVLVSISLLIQRYEHNKNLAIVKDAQQNPDKYILVCNSSEYILKDDLK